MNPVYILEAVRSPIGRRGKSLSTVHPVDLLGAVQAGLIEAYARWDDLDSRTSARTNS